ncbi:hypothetical protein N8T08_011127 [Aspergillus melleus]|uniref:Uncharacterized protein n=1 Tax=Aspergillus melleus TaxID=138277 RepID=A0ACC3AQ45_9EURO|nr:hypothetical protein N8T08_011127 [Aspergillus melleus]
MSLPTFPPELISFITDYLFPSIQDVNSLARTSKLLHRSTNPILYHYHLVHQGSAILIWAAKHGKPDPCYRFLREGANPNIRDPAHGRTPLSWAAELTHKDVVAVLLLSDETDPNAPDKHACTPLFWAAGNPRQSLSTMPSPYLSIPTADTLSLIMPGDDLAIVKMLVSHKDTQPDCRNKRGETPLAIAAADGAEHVVEMLLRTGKVDVNSKDKHGQTPLMAAARIGHIRIVKHLLAIDGVDVDTRSESGDSPLMSAARHGHAEIVQLLLDIPTVDPNHQPSFGDPALLIAVANGHVDVVEVLLASEKVDPNLPNRRGVTAIARAAQRNRAQIMRMLLDKGVEPDERDGEGNTPLEIASERGHIQIVKLLLSTGRVQLFELTNRKRAPFWAMSQLKANVVEALEDYKRRQGGPELDS